MADRPGSIRHLIAAGTARYERLPEYARELASVRDDLARVDSLFCGVLDYVRVLPDLGLDPTREQFRIALNSWFTERASAEDVVVIYYSGHGDIEQGRHYLLTADSDPADLLGTALETEFLARRIAGSKARLVLLLIDTCYSGTAAAEIGAIVQQVRDLFAKANTGIFVIAAARPKEEAQQGVFTEALTSAIHDERLGGERQQYLEPSSISRVVNRYFRDRGLRQLSLISLAYSGYDDPPFFPNPRYRGDLPTGIDLSTQKRLSSMNPADLALHWGPRARGVEFEEQPGWFFSGRIRILRDLVRWLRTPTPTMSVQVVTGGPGVGKSAVLARLITLADAAYRTRTPLETVDASTVPPEGSIHLAIHARGKTLYDLVQVVAEAVGAKSEEMLNTFQTLERRQAPFTVVVDALDEAREPATIVEQFLGPLGEITGVHLLVGTRDEQGLIQGLGPRAQVRRLDSAEYHDREALVRYVEERLLARDEPELPTPYRNAPELARQVARAVAEKADPVFLVARLTSEQLIGSRYAVDPRDPTWRAQLPSTVVGAFDEYLRRFGVDEWRVRDLLRPLAYAEGEGLPWEDIWATVASALSAKEYSDADVRWVRSMAGAYIVEAVSAGRSVYRLFHQALADYFRETNMEVWRQALIAKALTAQVPDRSGTAGKDWRDAPPYVRRHLSTHAAVGGVLSELLQDPLYCLTADPSRLLVAIDRSAESLPEDVVGVYQQSVHRIREASTLGEAASYFELAAQVQGQAALTAGIRRLSLDRPWTPDWMVGQPRSSHRVLETGSAVTALTLGRVGDQDVVVSGGSDGTVRLWDAVFGEELRVLKGHSGQVNGVALGRIKDRDIVFSGGRDGTIRRWDAISGEEICELKPFRRLDRLIGIARQESSVNAVSLGRIAEGAVVVSGGDDGTVRLWDAVSGEELRALKGHHGGVDAVALGRIGSHDVVVSGGHDRAVRLWHAATGRKLRILGTIAGAPKDVGRVTAVALGQIGGRDAVIFGGDGGTVRLLELGSQKSLLLSVGHNLSVAAVALGRVGTQDLVAVGCESRVVLFDAASGEELRVIKGHGGSITAVTLGQIGGRDVVVAGAGDGTVRLWYTMAGDKHRDPTGHEGGVISVAQGQIGEQDVVVTGGYDGTVRLWNAANGEELRVLEGHNGWATAVAIGKVKERDVVVSGGSDGTLRSWDVASGEQLCEFKRYFENRAHLRYVHTVVLGQTRGRVVVISAGADGIVSMWDLETARRRGGISWTNLPFIGGSLQVALGQIEDTGALVVGGWDGEVRLWNTMRSKVLFKVQGHDGEVTAVTMDSIRGRDVVASGGYDGLVRLWNAMDGEELFKVQGHVGWVTAVALGQIGGKPVVLSAGQDGMVRVWDFDVAHLLLELRLGAPITSLSMQDAWIAISSTWGHGRIQIHP